MYVNTAATAPLMRQTHNFTYWDSHEPTSIIIIINIWYFIKSLWSLQINSAIFYNKPAFFLSIAAQSGL